MAPRHRMALGACVAASVMAHAMLWWASAGVPAASRWVGPGATATTGRVATTWQVHSLPVSQQKTATSTGRPLPQPPGPSVPARPRTGSAEAAARPPAPSSELPPAADNRASSGNRFSTGTSGSAVPGTDPDTADNDSYLPRSALTRAPAPVEPIELPYPDLAPQGSFHAVLTLFIDEAGLVRRVRVEQAGPEGLPPELEDAARQTFLSSRFTPGELNGQAVRSQIRIAVDFAASASP